MSKIPNACYTCGKWDLYPNSLHTCYENPVIKDLKSQIDAAMKQVVRAQVGLKGYGVHLVPQCGRGPCVCGLETALSDSTAAAEAWLEGHDQKVREECWAQARYVKRKYGHVRAWEFLDVAILTPIQKWAALFPRQAKAESEGRLPSSEDLYQDRQDLASKVGTDLIADRLMPRIKLSGEGE
jgi:hypothetical protein